MNLAGLDRLLNRTPAVIEGLHPVSLAYLQEPVVVYPALEQLACTLDDPTVSLPQRLATFDTDPRYSCRFPVVAVEHDPFTPDLNRLLLEKYDLISSLMLAQHNVAVRIVEQAQRVETVVLVLLDGLSYSDCREWQGVEPCLAATPTITRIGFPAIVGEPPLAARLFEAGLTRRFGFTYWDRDDEPLSKRLFKTITNTHRLDPAQANGFAQVLDWLSARDLAGTYVQIVRSALDEYAEGHRTTIPREAVLQQIHRDLEAVLDVLQHKGRPAVLFAVSDHGILWKDAGHTIEQISFSGARYTEGRDGPGRGRCFEVEGRHYWVLDYPQMGRAWKMNEQGVHGGISFEESIVPFITWEVN